MAWSPSSGGERPRSSIPSIGTAALVGTLLSLTAMAALADPISVNNPSFETPPAGGFTPCVGTGCSYTVGQIRPGRLTELSLSESSSPVPRMGPRFRLAQCVLQVSLGWRNDMPSFVGTADLLVNGNQYFVTGATPAQGTGPFLRQRTLVLLWQCGRSDHHPIERRASLISTTCSSATTWRPCQLP